MAEKVFL